MLALSVTPALAFEIRRDEDRVTIAASETIDDTLLVTAEHVLIDGTITGDVIAFGEQVTIRGAIAGSQEHLIVLTPPGSMNQVAV